MFKLSLDLLTFLYWDFKGLFPLRQLCMNAVPCKSTWHTHSALFDGKVFLLKKATCWRHVFRDKWKSSLWRCGSISRCSAVDLVCVRETTSSLSNQTSWDFPNAVRDLHITGPVLVEAGIHWKKKKGMSGFISERYLTLRWDPQSVNETGRCISIKSESQRWPFTQTEKTTQVILRMSRWWWLTHPMGKGHYWEEFWEDKR